MGDEPSVNSCMSQIPLCFEFLILAFQLLSQELCLLSSDFCDAKILRSEGVDIGYHSFVSQLKEGIIDNESVWGRGMEGGEISVPQLVTIEVGVRERSGVKGGPIDRSVLCSSALQRYAIS